MHISSRFVAATYTVIFLNFCTSSPYFGGSGPGLHFSANKTSSLIFSKNIFGSTTHHFFTEL
jgi:hypothetical protein